MTSTDGKLTVKRVSAFPVAAAVLLRELIPSAVTVTLVLLEFCNLSLLSLSGSLQSALG